MTPTENNANRSTLSLNDDMDKETLVASVELFEKIASVGAILVAVGVVIEAIIGVALIVKHHKLKRIQLAEELAFIDRIEGLRSENLKLQIELNKINPNNVPITTLEVVVAHVVFEGEIPEATDCFLKIGRLGPPTLPAHWLELSFFGRAISREKMERDGKLVGYNCFFKFETPSGRQINGVTVGPGDFKGLCANDLQAVSINFLGWDNEKPRAKIESGQIVLKVNSNVEKSFVIPPQTNDAPVVTSFFTNNSFAPFNLGDLVEASFKKEKPN